MPMPPYPIYCISKGCKNIAAYKIAAHWSDGVQSELKTFALCCEPCLPRWFKESRAKAQRSRLAPHEILGEPGIYRLERGLRDRALARLPELEARFSETGSAG